MKQNQNLQPWLDYFDMLQTYEREDYLEVLPDKHEAYVVQSAIHAMSEGDNPAEQFAKAIPETARNIQAYASYISQEGVGYLAKPFALHVVKDELPHDLLYTMFLSRSRSWYKLLKKTDSIEVISYS